MRMRSRCSFSFLATLASWVVILATAGQGCSASSATAKNAKVPPFLKYLTRKDLNAAKKLASQRHEQCVKQALEHFDIDSIKRTPSDDEAAVANTPLKKLPVKMASKMPDYHDELPSSIFVSETPLLSKEECERVIGMADEHFAQHNNGEWTSLPTGEYKMKGFKLHDIPAVREFFTQIFRERFLPILQHTNPKFAKSVDDLVFDNCYLMKFTPQTGVRTDIHSDDGCLSFTIAMNPSEDYTGGGTWFEGLSLQEGDQKNDNKQDHEAGILKMEVGHVNFRAGAIRHCGHTISAGTRYVIGGFAIHRSKAENVRQLMRGNTFEEMEAALPAAVALNPQADEPYAMLAVDWTERRGREEDAKRALEYCLENVNPDCAKVAFSLGVRYYRREGQYRKVMDCMKICLATDPYDVDAMIAMADAADGVGDTETEMEMYKRIVSVKGVKPDRQANAYRDLGLLYKGKDAEAEIDCYKKSVETNDNYGARYSLGRALFEAGELSQARDAFLAAYGLGQDGEKVSALKALYRTAKTLMEQEEKENATTSSPEAKAQKMAELVGGEENYKTIQAMMAKAFGYRS